MNDLNLTTYFDYELSNITCDERILFSDFFQDIVRTTKNGRIYYFFTEDVTIIIENGYLVALNRHMHG